ncbi:MAG: CHASE domain-containing protein [Betaproteobacteria bacterium]|nr:CHASE domain-containing protein [Betaproteobacteria bacterium]
MISKTPIRWLWGFFLATAITLVIFNSTRKYEDDHAESIFQTTAVERIDLLSANIKLALGGLISIGAYYDASSDIDRSKFHRLTQPILKDSSTIQALEWVPRVPDSKRADYVQSARRDGYANFDFTERLQQGLMVPAGKRWEYYPGYFVEPNRGNENVMGFDLASEPERRAALDQSVILGQLFATSRITLVQDHSEHYGVLVFRPVYRGGVQPLGVSQRQSKLIGFVLGAFRISDIMESSAKDLRSEVQLVVFDDDATQGLHLLYPRQLSVDSADELVARFRQTRRIIFAGRSWTIVAVPKFGAFEANHDASVSILVLGLLIGFLWSAYLRQMMVRQSVIEQEIKNRTFDLNQERDFGNAVFNSAGAISLVLNRVGEIVRFNAAAELFTGYRFKEVREQSFFWERFMPPEQRAGARELFKQFLEGNLPKRYENNWQNRAGEPRLFDWSNSTLYDEQGLPKYLITVGLDITLQKHAEEEIRRLAYLDPLTGLPNRRSLEDHLERTKARAIRQNTVIAVGLIDLDDFKPINDSFGHHTGDKFLVALSQRMQQAMRATDFIARIGGDEFVIVLEDVDNTEHDALTRFLERLHVALCDPVFIDGHTLQVTASMGLALGAGKDIHTMDALMRQADRALYASKAAKGQRTSWWTLNSESPLQPQALEDNVAIDPYGNDAVGILEAVQEAMLRVKDRYVDFFYATLAQTDVFWKILQTLTPEELVRLKLKQAAYFEKLISPTLSEAEHHEMATGAGRIHAVIGIDNTGLMQSYELYRKLLEDQRQRGGLRLRRALPILHLRISQDSRWQLESYLAAAETRNAVLERIDELAWRAPNYGSLIEGAANLLAELEEVATAAIARPDAAGVLQIEALSTGVAEQLFRQIMTHPELAFTVDPDKPEAQGAMGRAWISGEIQASPNLATDQSNVPRRDLMMKIGLRSAVGIPLHVSSQVYAIVSLSSPYVSSFSSNQHRDFLKHLQRSLSLGLERLRATEGAPQLQGAIERLHHRQLLREGGLEMHYQPMLDLRTGKLVKVEALARLNDTGNTVLPPAQFLPSFGEDDLFELYCRGLEQALQDSTVWRQQGLDIDISLNLPPQGLASERYLQATRGWLSSHPMTPGHRLWLEVLETEELDLAATAENMGHWREMGVQFSEDDLGSGHSSLLRLRHLSFEAVKIDQGLVRNAEHDPLTVLQLVSHLVGMFRALNRQVIIEGLETNGLVEAATALSADLGQGHAIAKPMPAQDLLVWAKNHIPRPMLSPIPITAMGVLVAFLRFESHLNSLEGPARSAVALTPCGVDHFLTRSGLENSEIGEAHHAVHTLAAEHSLSDPIYQGARNRFLSLFVKQYFHQ